MKLEQSSPPLAHGRRSVMLSPISVSDPASLARSLRNGFECADGYRDSVDMATVLQPQTLMAFKLADEMPPRKYRYPFKIRIPTKLGFKNPKRVTALYVTNRQPGGFCTDRGYNWFSGS